MESRFWIPSRHISSRIGLSRSSSGVVTTACSELPGFSGTLLAPHRRSQFFELIVKVFLTLVPVIFPRLCARGQLFDGGVKVVHPYNPAAKIQHGIFAEVN